MLRPSEASGNIYDLGYRRYDGPRLGRPPIVLSLYLESVRSAFGLGRSPGAKVVPFTLLVVSLVPAAIHLGIAAAADRQVDIILPENYYRFIQIVLALFAAAVAPELVGRDQRNRTLPLYFSRPIHREDYVAAKYAALVTAMLALTLFPELVLFVGNALTASEPWTYARDNWLDVPRIFASAFAVSFLVAAVALAIASHTPRRAYATGAILGLFVISGAIGQILGRTAGPYAILLSLFELIRGTTDWIFNAAPDRGGLARDDVPRALVALVLVAVTLVASVILVRRYQGMRL